MHVLRACELCPANYSKWECKVRWHFAGNCVGMEVVLVVLMETVFLLPSPPFIILWLFLGLFSYSVHSKRVPFPITYFLSAQQCIEYYNISNRFHAKCVCGIFLFFTPLNLNFIRPLYIITFALSSSLYLLFHSLTDIRCIPHYIL